MLSTEFTNKLKESKQGQEYLDLVKQASLRNLEDPGVEIHHIFPVSLGGQDTPENKVKLTVFEHCQAHALLAQAIPCYKTLQPVVKMSFGQVKKLSDLEKVELENLVEWSRLREKALHQPKSEEHRRKMSEGSQKFWQFHKFSEKELQGRSRAAKGKVAIHREGDEHSKLIYPEELESYLKEGWIKGRTKATRERLSESHKNLEGGAKGRKCIHRDGRELKVRPEDVDSYLKEGWSLGRSQTFSTKRSEWLKGKSFTKGRVKIFKNNTVKLVTPESLQDFLNKGWQKGVSKQYSENLSKAKHRQKKK